MPDGFLLENLIRHIGQTVTIFTESGGLSGSGFTGVLAAVGECSVKLITDIGAYRLVLRPILNAGNICRRRVTEEANVSGVQYDTHEIDAVGQDRWVFKNHVDGLPGFVYYVWDREKRFPEHSPVFFRTGINRLGLSYRCKTFSARREERHLAFVLANIGHRREGNHVRGKNKRE